jgi:CheY-like chemotaxis protein
MTTATVNDANFKVFLVEDNEDTRLVLAQLLEATGYEVHTAASVQAALREFPLSSSEVLLSDLGLPDGSGWDLLRALRQAGSSPYAIAMSGYGTLADVAASRDAGFRHHLVKPIELDVLERLLKEAREEIGAH